jgi:hypothetical protein
MMKKFLNEDEMKNKKHVSSGDYLRIVIFILYTV